MPYKVFLVEDEIVTREGIRDNVDWKSHGFELCGEAPDGEIALPLLKTIRPDVLITDIKMPFMDGLQLSRVVRERLPGTKVIILSGHDEFEYAQEAIRLGVTEYLLKPVTVQDMHAVLQKIAALLEHEKKEQEKLQKLQDQVEENLAVLREKLLLKLAIGAIPSADAIAQIEQLDLDLFARYYLVAVIRIDLCDPSNHFDYSEYKRVQGTAAGLLQNNPDVFLLVKDLEELVLIFKGSTVEFLEEERSLLLDRIKAEVGRTKCRLTIGVGSPQKRLGDICHSFGEALVQVQNTVQEKSAGSGDGTDKAELLKVDRSAVEDYLKCGVQKEFNDFFEAFIRPLVESSCKSSLVRSYILTDIVLTTARFVKELGGDVDQVVPDLKNIEELLTKTDTVEQIREQVQRILTGALLFRDSATSAQRAGTIQKAKEYIDHHYMDEEISLNLVAAYINHSPSHFSAMFSQGARQTFKEYLTELRIKKAKELLRTTSLRSSEISYQVGYSDPHYFSYIFRKTTGLSPTEFRSQSQGE